MGVVVHRDERIGCKHHDLLNSSNSFTALFRLPFAPIGQSTFTASMTGVCITQLLLSITLKVEKETTGSV